MKKIVTKGNKLKTVSEKNGKEKSRSERSSENHPIKKKMIYIKSIGKYKKAENILGRGAKTIQIFQWNTT